MKSIDEDIRSGQFKPVYLLYGEEAYLRRQYKNKLCRALVSVDDTMNFKVYEGKNIDVEELVDQADTMPFFAEHRVICIEDSGFMKGKDAADKLTAYIPHMSPATCMIFVEEEIDRRSKLFKTVQTVGRAVEFAAQNEQVLTRWILSRMKKEDKKITGQVMKLFLDRVGTDMDNIDRELEKLFCYTMGRDVIGAEDVEAVTTEQTANKIFDMVNAVAEHNQRKALDYYYDLLTLREPSMRILSLLTKQFQTLMRVRDMTGKGFDQGTIAKSAGIPAFAVKKNQIQARSFSMEQLKQAVSDGASYEEAIKTGQMDEQIAVELLLMKYSEKTPA